MRIYLCLFSLLIALGSAGAGENIEKMSGYVALDQYLTIPTEAETSIEVFLKAPLLRMVSAATRRDEPELAEMIDGISLIRVQGFSVAAENLARVREEIAALAAGMEENGWERVARIREGDELIHVYLKTNGEKVDGLMMMGFENPDEAIFVNIVGDIDPAQIGRLGSKFNIAPLDSLRLDRKKASTSARGTVLEAEK
ncbi:MAG: DUF4252 domain-containing protein [Gemmatimonadetes bacterium]|jgi:hypothetical protein|nr:DUF4252 domain-containing protein [Gemmatimonadota bacterium]